MVRRLGIVRTTLTNIETYLFNIEKEIKMTIKRNLFAGGIITLLTVAAFTVERGLGRKSKAGWDVERQLRILSGANGVVHTQTGQAG